MYCVIYIYIRKYLSADIRLLVIITKVKHWNNLKIINIHIFVFMEFKRHSCETLSFIIHHFVQNTNIFLFCAFQSCLYKIAH